MEKDLEQELEETDGIVSPNLIEDDDEEESRKKGKNKNEKPHDSYSNPTLDAQILYEQYKNPSLPSYQNVDVVLYSYQVPWFATAMTDGDKIWFGPRMEFYDPHPNDRLYHELSHWRIATPYGTELDVETMAQIQLPRLNAVSISYKA